MLTIFSTPKPFKGHTGIIQRNAITSWTLLHPRPEIILFGNDEGTAEAAKDIGVLHVSEIARSEFGPPLLNDLFQKAEQQASHQTLCYVNTDIVLMDDLPAALARVSASPMEYLAVGRRWDLDVQGPLNFESPDWQGELRTRARKAGCQRPANWIDYFVFSKKFVDGVPPFAIGRTCWDNWLIWHARSIGLSVVDLSVEVTAVHQNHDYSHHPKGAAGVWDGEESKRNYKLAGGRWHLCTIDDATHLLSPAGLRPNPELRKQLGRRFFRTLRENLRFGALDWSRPIRKALGLRKKNRDALFARLRRLVSR
ncbi:MAG TPA: hypothetical protein VNX66_07335 [Candidatus Sulfotelmatobacter sp.]|jgi:hypothetical protein|nr:hypothetical protein [Candidatus Sulfotelmatobacter sp.]